MEPIVLAGAVEFSAADIALIFGVIAAVFVAVMSPGWALVAFAAHRRRTAQRPGPAWGAAVGGAVLGLLVCLTTSGFVGALLHESTWAGVVVAVLASWGACWGIARLMSPGEGWGR